jgi:hypothetical protein
MKSKVFVAPEYDKSFNYVEDYMFPFRPEKFPFKVFLAGTIDNGESLDWQSAVAEDLESQNTKQPIFVYNPRREKWSDGSDHDEITKQIKWELHHLEKADLIVMNILPKSKSPISLMELGLFAKEGKVIVFCQPSFYRYDNVSVVCEEYGITLINTNDILVIRNEVLKHVISDG